MIEEYRYGELTTFAGLPVFDVANPAEAETGATGDSADEDSTDEDSADGGGAAEGSADRETADLPEDVGAWAWRVGSRIWEEGDYFQVFAHFLETVDTTRIRAFIIGGWITETDMEEPAATFFNLLIEAAERFPALESLFLADIPSDVQEISWINQSDPGPLLAAFPRLREFGMRGMTGLTLEPFAHAHLEELTFQSGGLPPRVVRALAGCDLPALTGLDLYLGSRFYSGGADSDDLAGVLSGNAFPRLRHLGLRDAENANDVAEAVSHAPIIARLESLDLSLGNLDDEGAAALIAGQPLTHLKTLDLHHHYLSDAMIARLWEALPGVRLNVEEQESPDGHHGNRYIAVSE